LISWRLGREGRIFASVVRWIEVRGGPLRFKALSADTSSIGGPIGEWFAQSE
jgi:hypothetical protein